MRGCFFVGSAVSEPLALLYPLLTLQLAFLGTADLSLLLWLGWPHSVCMLLWRVQNTSPSQAVTRYRDLLPFFSDRKGEGCTELWLFHKWKEKSSRTIYRQEHTFLFFRAIQWFLLPNSFLEELAFTFTDNTTFDICKQRLAVRIADWPLCPLTIEGDLPWSVKESELSSPFLSVSYQCNVDR